MNQIIDTSGLNETANQLVITIDDIRVSIERLFDKCAQHLEKRPYQLSYDFFYLMQKTYNNLVTVDIRGTVNNWQYGNSNPFTISKKYRLGYEEEEEAKKCQNTLFNYLMGFEVINVITAPYSTGKLDTKELKKFLEEIKNDIRNIKDQIKNLDRMILLKLAMGAMYAAAFEFIRTIFATAVIEFLDKFSSTIKKDFENFIDKADYDIEKTLQQSIYDRKEIAIKSSSEMDELKSEIEKLFNS